MSELPRTALKGNDTRRRNRRVGLLLGAAILLAVAVVVLLIILNSRGDEGENRTGGGVVAEFAGEGDQTTNRFQVDQGWQIHWETTGERFAFAITGDTDYGTVIEQEGPGSGITSPVGSGSFRLEVTAEGSWDVTVVQGELAD